MFEKLVKLVMAEMSKVSVQQEDVVGIDITPEYIRLTQLANDKDDWVLTKLGYKFLDDNNTLQSIKDNPAEYTKKLKQLVTANKIEDSNAAISIPVSSAIIKVVTVPLMSDEELQQAIDTSTLWENVIQIADTLDDYSIFWQVIKRNTQENTLDLLFVASKLVDIETYIDIVHDAGLRPVVIDVRCFSMRNALKLNKTLENPEAPTVIVEIGQHENYVMIIRDDAPYISDIYVSDKDRNTLSGLTVDSPEYKVTLERLTMQINQVFNVYQSKYKVAPISSFLFTTTLPTYEKAIGYLQEFMPAVDIVPFEVGNSIVIPENLTEKVGAETNKTAFISAYGLATRKLDVFGYYQYVTGTSNINLMPNRNSLKNEEKVKFMSKWGIIAGAILFVIVAIVHFWSTSSSTTEVNEKLIEFNELTSQIDLKKLDISDLKSQKSELIRILSVSKEVRSNQKNMYRALIGVIKAVPSGVSLSTITYEKKIIELKGIAVSDQNILGLIENVEKSSVVESASLKNMSIVKEKKYEMKSFTIKVTLGNMKDPLAPTAKKPNKKPVRQPIKLPVVAPIPVPAQPSNPIPVVSDQPVNQLVESPAPIEPAKDVQFETSSEYDSKQPLIEPDPAPKETIQENN